LPIEEENDADGGEQYITPKYVYYQGKLSSENPKARSKGKIEDKVCHGNSLSSCCARVEINTIYRKQEDQSPQTDKICC
jgi:hypothetical protein